MICEGIPLVAVRGQQTERQAQQRQQDRHPRQHGFRSTAWTTQRLLPVQCTPSLASAQRQQNRRHPKRRQSDKLQSPQRRQSRHPIRQDAQPQRASVGDLLQQVRRPTTRRAPAQFRQQPQKHQSQQ
ncbi:MAG: hypothetical protein CFK49_09095 [Armatimonadetes bacterium JP3_11]|nr:MAG: hypothetical protein CFK49_09095 [Armatimonadetes bacterium JP3_11]